MCTLPPQTSEAPEAAALAFEEQILSGYVVDQMHEAAASHEATAEELRDRLKERAADAAAPPQRALLVAASIERAADGSCRVSLRRLRDGPPPEASYEGAASISTAAGGACGA